MGPFRDYDIFEKITLCCGACPYLLCHYSEKAAWGILSVSMKLIITLSNICHGRLNAPWGEQ